MKTSFQFAAVLTLLVLGATIDLSAQTYTLGRQTFAAGKTVASSASFQSAGVAGEIFPEQGASENFIITTEFIPEFNETCCVGRVGDSNGSGSDEPTLVDVTMLIDTKYISQDHELIQCYAAADINQSGGVDPTWDDVTLVDITTLIDYLYITGPEVAELPDCL